MLFIFIRLYSFIHRWLRQIGSSLFGFVTLFAHPFAFFEWRICAGSVQICAIDSKHTHTKTNELKPVTLHESDDALNILLLRAAKGEKLFANLFQMHFSLASIDNSTFAFSKLKETSTKLCENYFYHLCELFN